MHKNFLLIFTIFACLLSSNKSILAKKGHDKKKIKQEESKQPKDYLDYTDLKNVRLVFDKAMVACFSISDYDPEAWDKAAKLVDDLNTYWKIAYITTKKYVNKKKLTEKDQLLIKERLTLVNHLGHPLRMLGYQIKVADKILAEAVEVAEEVFPNSLLLADVYVNLANSYMVRGHNVEQAFEYFGKALEITVACLGEQHLNTAKIYYTIGHAFCSIKQYYIAVPYIKTSLNIVLKLPLKESSSLISKIYPRLGEAYEKQEAYLKAIKYYEAFLTLLPKLTISENEISHYTDWVQSAIKRIHSKLNPEKQKEGEK
ncbi:MAG: hypothetical protein BGO68_03095 [Candidatus Amoebophilus sp. 36-38]|nr:MAG: hypothetical protein BGO68_03095 [Candidatus Amoebophilus sp. 36-38]